MDANEIQKYIETTVEPKTGEAHLRSDRIASEGVRALWEIALHLSKLTEFGLNTFEMNAPEGGFSPKHRATD